MAMKNLYIFAGVNGAGKSTFYVNQLYKNGFFGARINSDEIVKEFGNWQSPKDQNRAGKIAIKLRKSYIERGIDFNIETTLSGHSIVKFIQDAKKAGYNITLYYVGLNSVELSKQRVAIRACKNGHSIDEAVLERRYKQSFDNLVTVTPICDTIHFFDNSVFIKDEQDQQLENLELLGQKQGSIINRNTNKKVLWFDDICEKFHIGFLK